MSDSRKLRSPFHCKACGRLFPLLVWGYCDPCLENLREMVDEAHQRELDEESAQSYAEYDLKPDEGGEG